ncbi:acetolactate synthase small subunit [Polaribacter pacificus]|uniref:Acetolactate synthase small subunit n=1 Tax=Polaribacter pacificus TaxID=1775173 RepID=A0A917HWE5_9FLAO|nr:acetolactate synthase small subunit [Polaribacter pacificus]GGG92025.1 acetolactate synthase small subunit [Polaribacter pacificus]
MNTELKSYTLSIYTENNIGLLNRVSSIFSKRHINIESLTASQSEIENVNRFVIVASMEVHQASKIVGQLEKQIEVIKAYAHTDEETIYQESALYKVALDSLLGTSQLQEIIKQNHAHIVTVSNDFFVIEKTGSRVETERLYQELKPHKLLQFVRSGRISISKEPMNISEMLTAF